mmetsp:Transcript_28594/g.39581  ORF Transcript_28594/g.39581 Transcript_28594/m.39581 type:complete len:222 (+) Transcript_28594:48-713(+)
MINFVFLIAKDTSSLVRASKVRGSALPGEFYLLRFIREVENPHPTWNANTPSGKWDGVSEKDCEIENILWGWRQLRGTLCWSHLPQSLVQLSVWNNRLTGTVEFHLLPPHLVYLNLSENEFKGILHLETLPRTLRDIWLGGNLFTGTLNFALLPPEAQELRLENNDFQGNVESILSPSKLRRLILNGNEGLKGKINPLSLPCYVELRHTGTQIEVVNAKII